MEASFCRTYGKGTLVRDSEHKAVGNGYLYNSRIAVERQIKKGDNYEKATSFLTLILWAGKESDYLSQKLKKGQQVVFEGDIIERTFEGKNGKQSVVEIIAQNIVPVDFSKKDTTSKAYDPIADAMPQTATATMNGFDLDDSPF